ncbi:MAG: hypothetical protein P8X90_36620 [Desulfobacterales bacterium]
MPQFIKLLKLILIFSIFTGCAIGPNYRYNPTLSEKMHATKSIVLIPLKTDVYQLTAGGVKEKMDEWSVQAKQNVMTAVQENLKTKPMLIIKPFEELLLSSEKKENLEETSALYDAVSSSIQLHTYGPPDQLFSDKIKNFDYSLGAEVAELAGDADAILFVSCVDHIATAGRKAVQAGSIILGALVGIQITPSMGTTSVSIALVDADSGFILWYNFHGSGGDHDLRDPINTTTLVKQLLKDLPI